LPLETRGIENVRCKKPRNDKEPTAKSYQNIGNSTSLCIPICYINYKKQCHFKPVALQIINNQNAVSFNLNQKKKL